MHTVIITQKPGAYPNHYTYTAYEFLVIGEETLRDIEMVLIEERVSDKKLRKIRNRMNAFNIVEIDMLPEDVIDVAESNVVQLPHGNVYVNRFKLTPAECFALNTGDSAINDATIARLSEEVCTLMVDANCNLLEKGSELVRSTIELMFQGLGVYDTMVMREKILTGAMMRYNARVNAKQRIRHARDQMMDKEIMEGIQVLKRIVHKHPFSAGEPFNVKPKTFLKDHVPVKYFKTKQELAEHLASQLPDTVEIRKRNALKFKVCCELNDAELLKLATDAAQQEALISKYR